MTNYSKPNSQRDTENGAPAIAFVGLGLLFLIGLATMLVAPIWLSDGAYLVFGRTIGAAISAIAFGFGMTLALKENK